jgi:hypothetical protein
VRLSFHHSLIFADKARAFPSGAPRVTPVWGRPLTLPANIRLGWKWVTATDTLAYLHVWINYRCKKFYCHRYILLCNCESIWWPFCFIFCCLGSIYTSAVCSIFCKNAVVFTLMPHCSSWGLNQHVHGCHLQHYHWKI